MDSDPEYARRFCGRKEPVAGYLNFNRTARDSSQSLCNRLDLFCFLLADELQSNMQRLGTHPSRLQRKAADALEKTRDFAANFLLKIDADKNSHGLEIVA